MAWTRHSAKGWLLATVLALLATGAYGLLAPAPEGSSRSTPILAASEEDGAERAGTAPAVAPDAPATSVGVRPGPAGPPRPDSKAFRVSPGLARLNDEATGRTQRSARFVRAMGPNARVGDRPGVATMPACGPPAFG